MSGASSRQIHGTLQVDGHAVRPSRVIAVSGDLASVVGADTSKYTCVIAFSRQY